MQYKSCKRSLALLMWRIAIVCVSVILRSVLGVLSANAEPFAYIANPQFGTAQVVDTAANTIAAVIPVPEILPWAIAVTPDGKHVYVAGLQFSVLELDAVMNERVALIPAGRREGGIAITPDGKQAYLTVSGFRDFVSVLDISTNLITEFPQISVGSASGIAITPDGKQAYAMNRDGHVVVIETATNTLKATISVGGQNEGIAVNSDGKRAYLTDFTSNSVFVLDPTNDTVLAAVPVNSQGPGHVFGLAITPDGKHVYVTSTGGHVSGHRYRDKYAGWGDWGKFTGRGDCHHSTAKPEVALR